MRLDKFLKVARIIKRRTVSKDLILANRVYVNNKLAKPAHELKLNDIVQLNLSSKTIVLRIKTLKEFIAKDNATEMYEVISEE